MVLTAVTTCAIMVTSVTMNGRVRDQLAAGEEAHAHAGIRDSETGGLSHDGCAGHRDGRVARAALLHAQRRALYRRRLHQGRAASLPTVPDGLLVSARRCGGARVLMAHQAAKSPAAP